MNDRDDIREMGLPEELRLLDQELLSIRYEERPSFAPELRAELARVWAQGPPRRPGVRRYLAAAAVAALLLATAAVPSARASLVRVLGVFSVDEPEIVETAEVPVPAPPLVARQAPAATPEPVRAEPEPETEVEEAADPAPVIAPTLEPSAPVAPQIIDRERAQALLQEAYPDHLQRAGVGGSLWLRVWVDEAGVPSLPDVARGSGVSELDRAAISVVPSLSFRPALQDGVPVSRWVEFPVVFEPEEIDDRDIAPPLDDLLRLPPVAPDQEWELAYPLVFTALPEPSGAAPARTAQIEAALADALRLGGATSELGDVGSVLSGVAPSGRIPTEWRGAAVAALEAAHEAAPANPAPLLALGRIRLRQGLRTDARMMFEQGLQISLFARDVPVPLIADLHFERGRLIRESWVASSGLGRVHASAFEEGRCSQARSSGRAASGYASVERLIAWNYLCPGQMEGLFERGFFADEPDVAALTLTMASFRAALDIEPGHVGSNVGLLLELAQVGRWEDVLAGARRFARHSEGHPHALLLAGIALQQLGRSDEAARHFDEALRRMPPADADQILDVGLVIDALEQGAYRRLSGEERRAWERSYWADRDRTPDTEVNERRVEHLARTAYALLRFGGVTSDPSEVWIRFGGPNHVHVVDGGAGQLTEFWDYGSGPDITFVRRVASQTMDLTPEGRAYVDDLGKIFPPQ